LKNVDLGGEVHALGLLHIGNTHVPSSQAR